MGLHCKGQCCNFTQISVVCSICTIVILMPDCSVEGSAVLMLYSAVYCCPFFPVAELLALVCAQVWKCVAADISSNKRSQFLLLSELEHEAGVSKSLTCVTCVNQFIK